MAADALNLNKYDFLAGEGEMAALMRAYDWRSTPLGIPDHWPHSLKTAVQIMLTSRFAMWMAWGPELTFFCNDAYSPTLGIKHPWALGKPADQVWAEIWESIGPRIEAVLETGIATWDQDLQLFLQRSGFQEETYHTFSYSPLPGDDGKTSGMLCVVSEETERVIGERRLAFLGELGSAFAKTSKEKEIAQALVGCIQKRPEDFPFALLYLFDPSCQTARLESSIGIVSGSHGAPLTIETSDEKSPWPLKQVCETAQPLMMDLAMVIPDPPKGPWKDSPRSVVLYPISKQAHEAPAGVFISALNPYQTYGPNYAGFIEILVGQIAAGLLNAHAYEQERRRAEELAKLDQVKTAFFSNVSHELRTPLTLMLGPLEEAMHGDAAEDLQMAHRNGLRLLRMVNTLLDFSRLEAGKLSARFEATDLSELTSQLASNFRVACDRAGIRLIVDCPPLTSPVYVDREMWEKIVLNLLSNALKNTFEGEIRVALREEIVRGSPTVTLTVSDTGTGIPKEALGSLFERFYRVEGSQGRTHEGTGIGLSLVQELVQLHKGAVEVESELGKGSSFSVQLPSGREHLPEGHVVPGARTQEKLSSRVESYVQESLGWMPAELIPDDIGDEGIPEGGKDRRKILVADDNADMRSYLQRLLSPRYALEMVANGIEALEAAERSHPDLIISDVMMPGLDGFGLLDAVRKEQGLKDVPVLLLSARAGEEAKVEGLGQGADDYLVKPFSARELLARTQSLLDLSDMRREHYRREASLLQESKERLQRFADALPIIAWESEADSTLAWINPRFAEYTGVTTAIPGAAEFQAVIYPDDLTALAKNWQQARVDGQEFMIEVRLRRSDGVYRWWLARIAPQVNDSGQVVRWYGSATDIQDQKDVARVLEETVETRTAELKEANQEMEGFTYSVSHDLRSPLRAIVFTSNVLLEELGSDLSEEHRDLLARQAASASRLARLIDDLLKLSRITRQEMRLELVDLSALAEEVTAQITLPYDAPVEFVIHKGLQARADPQLVQFVLSNLFENAVKFSPQGGRIEFGKTISLGKDCFFIRDQGVGFEDEYVGRIFEPFERLVTEREFPGTGIGLANVKRIVQRHKGDVWAESRPDEGATFYFTLS